MLNHLQFGSGKTNLVLIHGYCENNTCFNKQVLFFKDHCNVITLDLPGFGKSASIQNVSIDDMAEEVAQLLDHLQIEKCVMLGHSMGGYVTLAFAEKFGNRLSGFGLIHSTALEDNEERKEKRLQVVSFVETHGKEAYIKNFIPGLFKPGASQSDIDFSIEAAMEGAQEGITQAALAMMNRPNRLDVLKKSKVPVFFGVGKHDALIPEQAMFAQAAICNCAHIAYLQGSAHMGMVEEPELLNSEILAFLKVCGN